MASTQHRLGLGQAVALYLGAILGAGVLVLPGVTAAQAGPGALLSWAFVGALGLPLGLTFARLASAYPDAGGVAVFARRAFGERAGVVSGWWFFVAGSVGQAIVPLTAGYYIAEAAGGGQTTAFVAAAALLAAAAGLNVVGLTIGARAQLGLALAVGAFLVGAVLLAAPAMDPGRLDPVLPHGFGAVALATIPLFYAFAGWEVVAHLAPEFRDPARDLSRATVITVGVVLALYLALVFAVLATGSYGDTGADRVAITALLATALGDAAPVITALVATVIALGTSNAYIAGTSRLGYALGRDGDLPRALGRLGAGGSPLRAIAAVTALAAIGLVTTAIAGGGAEDLVFVPSSLVVATYVVAMASGVRLLRGRPRAGAAIGLVAVVAVVPFVGAALVVPLAVAGLALAYRARPRATTPTTVMTPTQPALDPP